METGNTAPAAVRGSAVSKRGQKQRAQSKPQSDITADRAIAQGLARLIEGQRRFGEEFGLPLSRIFSDEFESFRGKDSQEVINEWLSDDDEGAQRLEILFDDLVAHQVALLSALDDAVSQALKRGQKETGSAAYAWKQALRATFGRGKNETVQEDQTLRYLHFVAPTFVAAYARAREQVSTPAFLAYLKQKTISRRGYCDHERLQRRRFAAFVSAVARGVAECVCIAEFAGWRFVYRQLKHERV
ncbi:hypothetical protein [Alkalilimnicola ehrlichii]|uniref:hypothetical protein n=1 Tax=Alkalilimnicola ehrlichii TaxID=351052 RepID=UPI0015F281A3|nr:hypothetical protein [Alkalilimnicola ehrlichii]